MFAAAMTGRKLVSTSWMNERSNLAELGGSRFHPSLCQRRSHHAKTSQETGIDLLARARQLDDALNRSDCHQTFARIVAVAQSLISSRVGLGCVSKNSVHVAPACI